MGRARSYRRSSRAAAVGAGDIAGLIARLEKAGGVPISLRVFEPAPIDTGKRLTDNFGPVTVAFPPCSVEMLALIKTTGVKTKDDITKYFDEYFKFGIQHDHHRRGRKCGVGPAIFQCDNFVAFGY
jgi:hypothetical protein